MSHRVLVTGGTTGLGTVRCTLLACAGDRPGQADLNAGSRGHLVDGSSVADWNRDPFEARLVDVEFDVCDQVIAHDPRDPDSSVAGGTRAAAGPPAAHSAGPDAGDHRDGGASWR